MLMESNSNLKIFHALLSAEQTKNEIQGLDSPLLNARLPVLRTMQENFCGTGT